MTLLNPLDALIPKIPFSFFSDFWVWVTSEARGSVSVGFWGSCQCPFWGRGGSGRRALSTPPPRKRKPGVPCRAAPGTLVGSQKRARHGWRRWTGLWGSNTRRPGQTPARKALRVRDAQWPQGSGGEASTAVHGRRALIQGASRQTRPHANTVMRCGGLCFASIVGECKCQTPGNRRSGGRAAAEVPHVV